MSFTGKLGTSDSSLGNIELGTAGSASTNVSDTVTVSDATTEQLAHLVGVSDTVTVTDAIAASHSNPTSVADNVTLTDAAANTYGPHAVVSDTVTVSDSLATHAVLSAGTADTVTVTDATTPKYGAVADVSDHININEGISVGAEENIQETVDVFDAVAPVHGLTQAATDTVALSDSLSFNNQIVVADTVTVFDATGLNTSTHPSVADTVPVNDVRTTQHSTHPSVADSVTITDSLGQAFGKAVSVSDSASVSDALTSVGVFNASLVETVVLNAALGSALGSSQAVADSIAVSDTTQASIGQSIDLAIFLPVSESLSVGTGVISNGTTTTAHFGAPLRIEGVPDVGNYAITPASDPPFPVLVLSATPILNSISTGTSATVLDSHTVQIPGATLGPSDVGGYIFLNSPMNTIGYSRILNVVSSDTAVVDRALLATDPMNGSIPWELTTGVKGVELQTTKPTNGGIYTFSVANLQASSDGTPFFLDTPFPATSLQPRLTDASFLDNGQVLLTFSDVMLTDPALTDPREYSVTGPSAVTVQSAQTVSDTQVLLHTVGAGFGSYMVTVNATGTPHDFAGNPIDPTFNQAIFNGSPPLDARSIFVDHGPIAKPPLIIQTGVTATIVNAVTVSLPTATLSPTMVGLSLTLTGSLKNGGTFIITSVPSPTQVRVAASFSVPDPANGTIAWKVFDPRDGQIADDPTDVTVTINSIPVTPDAVVGLLGQIVLSAPPVHGDVVDVDYSWICNPTVDARRMNSTEFRFNSWNRNGVGPFDPRTHTYRYNNTMVVPRTFNPLDIQARLAQPLQRDLKYRAYERAYSAILNDPNLLLFNSPTGHIAFPPLSRSIPTTFINYQATILPENDGANPWTREGTGSAVINVNELIVSDTSTGPFPGGQPIYWTRPLDLTFPHVFAIAWRMTLNLNPISEGVFTGVAAGYADDQKAVVIGFLNDGGTRKIGILLRGGGNDPSLITSWGGSGSGAVAFDWSTLHSYRVFQDVDGTVHFFVDGGVVDTLTLPKSELPFLEELNDPFNELQGVYFGSLSRQATNVSTWDFVRYTILPTNPFQSAPSIFVSYEGDTPPEDASEPWTPVGFHGTETIVTNDHLILDSTSATTPTAEIEAGLVSGDFKGFFRIEPLLQVSSDVVLDVGVSLRTYTHGITPNAVMAAVDDGQYLVQLCFFPDKSSPLLSYGGRSFPDEFVPYTWTKLGGAAAEMIGQILRIEDTTAVDGLVYFINDSAAAGGDTRVVSSLFDYMFEFRARVISHTADINFFAGVNADVFDGVRDVGVMFQDVAGVKFVTFHSDGAPIAFGQFTFNWDDGQFHTYRVVKSTGGNLVSLFVDTVLIGTLPYSNFTAAVPGPIGVVTFGSSTPASVQSLSTVDWMYCNAWRVNPVQHQYVGLWRGFDSNALTGYHLPLKVSGRDAQVGGNALGDANVNFVAAGVVVGDVLIVDVGPNKGVYNIASVAPNLLTVDVSTPFPVSPTTLNYRIPSEVDWTLPHRYRVVRDPGGGISVFLDTLTAPIIAIGYNQLDLPSSIVGLPDIVAAGMPSISWGAFDPTNLSQTSWDYVRFGITRQQPEKGIVPHHQILNQRNVIASYEHHTTSVPHPHTDFWSESEGIPPQTLPDLLRDPTVVAYTLLNEGTPLVPSTQTFEVRKPTPVLVPVAGFNRIEDLMNSQAFVFNEGGEQIQLLVPNDILYNSLEVIERDTGEPYLIAPFDDECQPTFGPFRYQKEVCLEYTGDVLPEDDTAAPTPWVIQSDDASHVIATAFAGVLTYGTDATGTNTIYRNNTPLPDAPGLQTEVKFKLRLLNDSSLGLGDSQVRFGLSAPGFTVSLGLVTTPIGERRVVVYDQQSGNIVGSVLFDFLDGALHTYRLVRDIGASQVQIFIDS